MNSVALVGRLVRDPELRYASGAQTAVTRFTLAIDRPYPRNNETDFISVIVFGKSAENCANYLAKGRQVAVQGRIQTGSYQTKTGEKRYTTDVIAERVEFLDRGNSSQQSQRTASPYPLQDGGSKNNFQDNSGFNSEIPDGFHAFDDEDDENIPF